MLAVRVREKKCTIRLRDELRIAGVEYTSTSVAKLLAEENNDITFSSERRNKYWTFLYVRFEKTNSKKCNKKPIKWKDNLNLRIFKIHWLANVSSLCYVVDCVRAPNKAEHASYIPSSEVSIDFVESLWSGINEKLC